jgi:hypothetical protein
MRKSMSLMDDSRGAVLVMGLVMATVLVGLLWHLVGVGDAIVYRERMQEAADSTAFESAVWHARTMNLLVVLNVVMSAILAVLIIWRTIELLLEIAAILLFLMALVPGFQGSAALAEEVQGWVETMVQKDISTISKNVKKGLERVNKAEKMVATWAPVINVVAPTATNTEFFGRGSSVHVTFPVSLSLIPPVEAILPDKAGVSVRMNMGPLFPAMPVEEGKYDDLCSHAAKFVPNTVQDALRLMKAPDFVAKAIGKIGSAFDSVVKAAPEFFCKPLTAPEPGKDEIDAGAKKDCKDREEEFKSTKFPRLGLMCFDKTLSPTCLCDGRWVDGDIVADHKGCCSHHGGILTEPPQGKGAKVCASPDAGPALRFDEKECEEIEHEEADKKKKTKSTPEVSGNPAAVWSVAKNGYAFLQVWSFANGDPNVSFGDDPGVAVANHGDAGSRPNPLSYQFALAQAEYYNDAGEDLWSLGWRARLRRVRDPLTMSNAAEWVGNWTTGKVTAAIKKVYSGKAGQALDKLDKALAWIQPNGELYNNWWTEEAITKRAAKTIHNGVYDAGLDNFGGFVADHLIGTAHKKIIH